MIFGLALCAVLLLSKGETPNAETNSTSGAANAITTTAESTGQIETTTEFTEVTTEEINETTAPKITEGWITGETDQQLLSEVPGIWGIVTEGLDRWLPDIEQISGYSPLALFMLGPEQVEVAEQMQLTNYAVLWVLDFEDKKTESDSKEDEKVLDTMDFETTEEPKDPAKVVANDMEVDAQMVPSVENANLVLASDTYILTAFGNDSDMQITLRIFAYVVSEEHLVAMRWYLENDMGDLNQVVAELLDNDQWWRYIESVTTDEVEMQNGKKQLGTKRLPVLRFYCENKQVFIFREIGPAQAKNLASELERAGYLAYTSENMVAVLLTEPE